MKYIALDIGTKRTGVAFLDTQIGIPVPLCTIEHSSLEELMKRVFEILRERHIDECIVGNPLLPDGSQGSQSQFVETVVSLLKSDTNIPISLTDERYSNRRDCGGDHHAAAAILLLAGKI